jgi:hypothetical protein
MGTPHWGGVHKKGNEPTVFPEYRHQKEIGQDMVGLLCVFNEKSFFKVENGGGGHQAMTKASHFI